MTLTIDQVKEKKIKLESDILDLIKEFEDETKTIISYINFSREVTKDEKGYESPVCIPEPERQGPVNNVEASLRFDI